jgi:hypothetical protein
MAAEDPNKNTEKSTKSEIESKDSTVGNVSSALGGTQGPAIRVVVPGKPDMQIWLQGVPMPLFNAFDHLAKPSSIWKSILKDLKDLVPALSSFAAVLISLAALIYTNHQKNAAEALAKEQREKAADAAQKKALADLIKEFGNTVVPDAANSVEESQLEITAMKFAAYGDQALPAIRMALGASFQGLRHGGVLVAEQMYRAETVEREKLVGAILGYYNKTRSPVLQRGVLEWLVKMNTELSGEESALALGILKQKQSFGPKGENCVQQDDGVASEVVNFLPIWPTKDSRELLNGMTQNCKSSISSQASTALRRMDTPH